MMQTTATANHVIRRKALRSVDEQIKWLRAEYPKANNQQIANLYKQRWRERVLYEDDQMEFEAMEVLDYFLKTRVDAILGGKSAAARPSRRRYTHTQTAEQKAAAKAQRKELVATMLAKDEQRIEAAVTIRLMEYKTIYGKELADCTGAECLRLSERYGPFFREIANRLNPRQRVRSLGEARLQAIALEHRLYGPEAVR